MPGPAGMKEWRLLRRRDRLRIRTGQRILAGHHGPAQLCAISPPDTAAQAIAVGYRRHPALLIVSTTAFAIVAELLLQLRTFAACVLNSLGQLVVSLVGLLAHQ